MINRPHVMNNGAEPFHFLIGRADTVTPVGIIVVHDHRVHAQVNDIGPRDLQPPYEKLLQNLSENEHFKDAEISAEVFDGVR